MFHVELFKVTYILVYLSHEALSIYTPLSNSPFHGERILCR